MSYRDEVMALEYPVSLLYVRGFRIAQERSADIAARADARIAELERDIERLDAQWREELRIYRESGDARIAELEAALLAERERICAAIKATDDAASDCDYMLDSDDCIRVIRGELGPDDFKVRKQLEAK